MRTHRHTHTHTHRTTTVTLAARACRGLKNPKKKKKSSHLQYGQIHLVGGYRSHKTSKIVDVMGKGLQECRDNSAHARQAILGLYK